VTPNRSNILLISALPAETDGTAIFVGTQDFADNRVRYGLRMRAMSCPSIQRPLRTPNGGLCLQPGVAGLGYIHYAGAFPGQGPLMALGLIGDLLSIARYGESHQRLSFFLNMQGKSTSNKAGVVSGLALFRTGKSSDECWQGTC